MMKQTARKINFLIEEDVARQLESLIPAGKRSRIVNEALRRELELVKRKSAVNELLSESEEGRRMTTNAIISGLSSDREDH
jgi:hypothetical protein